MKGTITTQLKKNLPCSIQAISPFLLSFIILIFSSAVSGLYGQEDASIRAKAIAEQFLSSKFAGKKVQKSTSSLNEVYQSPDTVRNKLYFFQDAGSGFAIVADVNGDMFVTAYSDKGRIDTSSNNQALKILRNYYEQATDFRLPVSGTMSAKNTTLAVAPLLEKDTIRWNQSGFYDLECPLDASLNRRAPAGCVAVTMGQIMRYFKYPSSGTGSNSYTSKYGVLNADFGNTTYKWNEMPGSPSSPNAAISKLLYHCGVGVNMGYGYLSYNGLLMSGASIGNAITAFQSYFRYNNADYIEWGDFRSNIELFYQIIRDEIASNRPVFYALGPGSSPDQSFGHTVVCDGFDNNYFHLNFGWSGMSDGYYLLEGFQAAGGYDFFMKGSAIVGLSPKPIKTNEQDSLALVAIYKSTNGDQWKNRTGWLQTPVNKWYGVTAVGGRVIRLDLSWNTLSGTLPKEIGNLSMLHELNLGTNQITGSIPKEIGNLSSLYILNLGNNSLSGTIPPETGNLANLRELQIFRNKLTGTIPVEISKLTNLTTINLSDNKLTGSIPDVIYNMTGLTDLNLAINQLTGTISPGIGNLTKLLTFSVRDNLLTGSLTDKIGYLTLIKDFDIAKNKFSGSFPASTGTWTNLQNFYISENSFEGKLPDAVCNSVKLTSLYLSNNKFTGLPDSIGRLTLLQSIEAANNEITTIPASVSKLTKLYRLLLDNNKIDLIPDLGDMPALWDMNLSANRLESLPESFGKMTRLSSLLMNNNLLSDLPASFENLTKIETLEIRENKLSRIPVTFCFLTGLKQLYINRNLLSGPIPPISHLNLMSLDIRNNKFIFDDIASSMMPDDTIFTDDYEFSYWDQSIVPLTDSIMKFPEGDSAGVDIRKISRMSHYADQYKWYKGSDLVQEGPVLSFKSFKKENEGSYTCRITNKKYRKLLELQTKPLIIKSASVDPFENGTVLSSRTAGNQGISDNILMLFPADGIRGTISWQASYNPGEWVDVNTNLNNASLKQNKVSVAGNKVLLEPVTPMMFRYMIKDGDCNPVPSDTVKIKPYGIQVTDTLLNVRNKSVTVSRDSIEITIPANLTQKDFKLTIKKLNDPPAFPDSVIAGTVYDVNLSFGSVFDAPLFIRLKNFKDKFNALDIDRFRAVWYDEANGKWVPFGSSRMSLEDSSLVFETNHLTKLGWFEYAHGSYTHIMTFGRVNVIYRYRTGSEDNFYQAYETSYKNKPESWYNPNTDPDKDGDLLMAQDIAGYLTDIMNKFDGLGLETPGLRFNVYLGSITGASAAGSLDYGGYLALRGYMYVDPMFATDRSELKTSLAHEYFHYTQDYYMIMLTQNYFWQEATAPLADRMVWNDTEMPAAEPEQLLNQTILASGGNKSIFDLLAASWDDFSNVPLICKRTVNSADANTASTFLHYMRSYRPGDKLKPEELLRETSYLGSWLSYLDGFIATHLKSTVGDEYENFVKYLIEGGNEKFTLLDKKAGEDPLKYFFLAPVSFMQSRYVTFKSGQLKPSQKENIKLSLPYLSTKMLQIYNLTMEKTIVRLKRKIAGDPNNKVYLCRYDSDTKRMIYEDLSDQDSTGFIIEPHKVPNIEENKDKVYLLFINKDKSKTFEENYDIAYYPVPDLHYWDAIGFYSIYNGYLIPTDLTIHRLTDGVTESLGILDNAAGPIRKFPQYFGQVSYNIQTGDETIETIAGSKSVTQTISYNFVKGDMTIHHLENLQYLPTDPVRTVEIEIVLGNVWLTPYSGVPGDWSRYFFHTFSTAETQKTIKSLTYTKRSGTIDPVTQQQTIVTTTYLGTQYGSGNIAIQLQFY
jgi:Leucine-rich repeat (LRR) protein